MSLTQKSLILPGAKEPFIVVARPIPDPKIGEVLVHIEATALNPVDWKVQAGMPLIRIWPTVLGSDAAGVVEKVGEGVTSVAVGDKVLYQGKFNTNDSATFQQYSLPEAVHVAKIPIVLSFEEAASVPLGFTTAAIGLYQERPSGAGLVSPWTDDGRGKANGPILIIGGSTSVGQYVVQLSSLSGFSPIITTSSLKHSEYLKSLGATHVLDRSLPLSTLPSKVKEITSESLSIVYDSVSEGGTGQAAYDVLASKGTLILVLTTDIVEDPKSEKTIIQVVGSVTSVPQHHKFGVKLYEVLEKLLESGDIKPNRVEVVPGGLNGIAPGLARLEAGQVSGIKLVVKPEDTA